VFVPGGAESVASLRKTGAAMHFVREAFQHAKPIGGSNEGVELIAAAELPDIEISEAHNSESVANSRGVVTGWGAELTELNESFVNAIKQHRHFDRTFDTIPG
jgi:catalase